MSEQERHSDEELERRLDEQEQWVQDLEKRVRLLEAQATVAIGRAQEEQRRAH